MRTYKKDWQEENVYEASVRRIEKLYDLFDTIVVSFSGGKDSTVALNIALEVAKKRNRLPLIVYSIDEEAIHPETVEYMERVAANPDIDFRWYCIPVEHRNACSRKQLYWYPWNPEKKDLWVRPLPEGAITELPEEWMYYKPFPEIAPFLFPADEYGSVADVRGLRADESLRRYQAVASKLEDNWIAKPRNGNNSPTSPIYDWTSFDIWMAMKTFGWDYSRAYDKMTMFGMPLVQQRVCPPFGEEPLRNLRMYKVCWPEMWDKMVNRVHGANTAVQYCDTQLYSFGKVTCPPGLTFKEWTFKLLELYPPENRDLIKKNILKMIKMHKNKTNRPIHDSEPDEYTGISWKYIAMIANRGDTKGRRAGKAAANTKTTVSNEDLDSGTRY